MQYRDIEQQKLREENVLKSLQHANECGENCKYSEEQILEAQRQLGKGQLNDIYSEVITPILNSLFYFIYSLTTLVLMPILYVNNRGGANKAAVIAYVLILIMLIIIQVIESSVKKDTEKNREWIIYFDKFSNDTYKFNYLLTSLGYLMVILVSIIFWYTYILMVLVFSIAIFFDFVRPLVIKFRQHS